MNNQILIEIRAIAVGVSAALGTVTARLQNLMQQSTLFNKQSSSGIAVTKQSTVANVQHASSLANLGKNLGNFNSLARVGVGATRAIGTSMIFAGGAFRQLGVAINVTSSLFQAFIPVISGVLSALGPFQVLFYPLAASFAAATIELGAFIGVLGLVAKTGIELNTIFETSKIQIAALLTQFYDFRAVGSQVNMVFADTAEGMEKKFNVAVGQASKALDRLSVAGLASIYTTQQLLPAFQAVTLAMGGLNSSEIQNIQLTAKLANAAATAGISAGAMAVAFRQALNGTLRITNALKPLFAGLGLTNDKIKELRATSLRTGGTEFIDTFLKKLDVFRISGAAAANTMEGLFSNLNEAFQTFSRLSTTKFFDEIKRSAKGLYETIFDTKKIDEILTSSTAFNLLDIFQPKFQELAKLINNLLEKAGTDTFDLVGRIIGFLGIIGDYLIAHQDQVFRIYDAVVLIGQEVFGLIGDIFSLLGVTKDVGKSADNIEGTLERVGQTIALIRDLTAGLSAIVTILRIGFEAIGTVILLMVSGLLKAASVVLSIISVLAPFQKSPIVRAAEITNKAGGYAFGDVKKLALDIGNQADYSNALTSDSNLTTFNKTLAARHRQTEQTRQELAYEEKVMNVLAPGGVATVPKKNTDAAAGAGKKGKTPREVAVIEKSLMNEERALFLAQSAFKLGLADREFEAAKNTLASLRDINDNDLKENLVAIQEYYTKKTTYRVADLQNELKKIEAEHAAREAELQFELAALKLEPDRIDDNRKAALKALPKVHSKSQVEKINADALHLVKVNELKIQELTLKINTENLKTDTQRRDKEFETVEALRKGNEERAKAVEHLGEELVAINAAFDDEVKSNDVTARYSKIEIDAKKQLEMVDRELTSLADQKAGKDENELVLLQRQVFLATIAKENLIKQVELKKINLDLSVAQNAIDLETNGLNVRLAEIDRLLNRGQITRLDAQNRTTAATKEYQLLMRDIVQSQLNSFAAIGTPEALQKAAALKLEFERMHEVIDETAQAINSDVSNAFNTFFTDLQKNIGNARDAFRSLALSILGSIQKVIADSITQKFMLMLSGKNPDGTPKGNQSGIGGFFSRVLGLKPAPNDLKPLEKGDPAKGVPKSDLELFGRTPYTYASEKIMESSDIIAAAFLALKTITEGLTASFTKFDATLLPLKDVLPNTVDKTGNLKAGGSYGGGSIFGNIPNMTVPGTPEDIALANSSYGGSSLIRTSSLKGTTSIIPGIVPAIGAALPKTAESTIAGALGTVGGDASSAAIVGALTQIQTAITASLVEIKTALTGGIDRTATALGELKTSISTDIDRIVQAVTSEVGVGSNLDGHLSNIEGLLGQIRDEIKSAGGNGSDSESNTSLIGSLGSLFSGGKGSLPIGGFEGKAAIGGYISGAGGPTDDKVPAMLSNGEFVLKASAVKKLGIGYLHWLNSIGHARGGEIKNFLLGGAASKALPSGSGGMSYSSFFSGKGGILGGGGTSFLKSPVGGGLMQLGMAVAIGLLGRLFAKKQPKSDPNRVKDPFGLNPDTLTYYKKVLISGSRNYLAKGGLVQPASINAMLLAGMPHMAMGGLADLKDVNFVDRDENKGTVINQKIDIHATDVHSFRNSRGQIERDMSRMAQRGANRRKDRY